MKKLALATVAAATLMIGAVGTSAPAAARDTFAFSFDTGGVAFAYSDGYWDRDHRWHRWRNAREARAFREMYRDRYWHRRHNAERNSGWRDWDHDGVPNRFDARPNNPYRN
jgi:hypothetical protein